MKVGSRAALMVVLMVYEKVEMKVAGSEFYLAGEMADLKVYKMVFSLVE